LSFILTKCNARLTHNDSHCTAVLVTMFVRTVIEAVYLFLLPNFAEDCNRLLPDGAADSVRCFGLHALSMCCSTMPACELSASDSEETVAT